MANYGGDPDWATPSGGGAAATTSIPTSSSPAPNYSSESSERGCGSCAQRMLSIINLCLSALMAALGVLSLIEFNPGDSTDYSMAFVASYMVIFAILLATYEFLWWIPIEFLNKSLRKNFGFMYGIKGKAAYLIFVAFLTIGLQGEDKWKGLKYATGISYLAVGVLHMFLVCYKPELVEGYKAPTTGFNNV